MSWNESQLQMLRAMGHEPMLLASLHDQATAGRIMSADPAADVSGAATDPVSARGSAAVSAAGWPALLQALRRAAGDRDVSELVHDLDRLRREPKLKRALWPQLRALRRRH